jgi:hypothetical protein
MTDDATQLAERRIAAATAAGLPTDQAKRLRGTTAAELEADATWLAASLGQEKNTTPEPETMSDRIRAAAGRKTARSDDTVSLDGGARQSTTTPQDMNEWIRERASR